MKWIAPHGATTSTERYKNAQPTIAGSNPDAAFFNTVLDELLAVIVAANMIPTDENLHQIADAIVYLTERAATSGVTKGSFWFGKTTANFTVPNPTLAEQNYIDFTTLKTYSAKSDLSGWTQSGTFVPPVGIDFTILITSKFWDIPEQTSQQGGEAKYNHTDQVWAYWPKIISFHNAALTGTPTAPTPNPATSNTQIATTAFVKDVLESIYPVGSVYIGTQNTCPMGALFGTWELVAIGRALWGGDGTNANTTIAAGLPNITGGFSNWGKNPSSYGVFQHTTDNTGNRDAVSGIPSGIFTFNADRSSSVFGASNTVQPPAYVVNVWRRIA